MYESKLISCFEFPVPLKQAKNCCRRAAGNGRLITSLVGKGRQNHRVSSAIMKQYTIILY